MKSRSTFAVTALAAAIALVGCNKPADKSDAKADGAKVVDADIKSFQAVGAKVRDQYTAKNPLIADFFKQAKDL